MDLTQSTGAAAAKPARSGVPEKDVRSDVRNDLRNAVRHDAEAPRQSSGYGMPCAKCRLYYPANIDACPACNSKERVSPNMAPAIPKPQVTAEPLPDTAVV